MRAGQAVRVKEGHTLDHADKPVDCFGMRGVVDDSEPYESQATGELCVPVQLDSEFGGGHVHVPESRLQANPGRAGYSRRYSDGWRRIFGGGR